MRHTDLPIKPLYTLQLYPRDIPTDTYPTIPLKGNTVSQDGTVEDFLFDKWNYNLTVYKNKIDDPRQYKNEAVLCFGLPCSTFIFVMINYIFISHIKSSLP